MSWRPVAGITTLRRQVDKRFPRRDRRSDGVIGDKAHQKRPSDHNPDKRGFVHAVDIDADLLGPDGGSRGREFADRLAEELRLYAKSRIPGSERIKYIVYNNRIASGTYKDRFWTWRKGNWGHEHHIHVSFTTRGEADRGEFPIPLLRGLD